MERSFTVTFNQDFYEDEHDFVEAVKWFDDKLKYWSLQDAPTKYDYTIDYRRDNFGTLEIVYDVTVK